MLLLNTQAHVIVAVVGAHADQHGPLDLEGPLEDRRDLIGCADHEASRSECPCVLHRVHRFEGDFGLAAVLLEFLTARDVVGAVDPDQMPVSDDSLNQLALNCCVQADAVITALPMRLW
jgi:hypothetical protein